MKFLIKFVVLALVILGLSSLLPGFVVGSFWSALGLAVVLALVNLFIRPVLIILTLPVTLLTLGLFLLVINALMLWLAASFVPGVGILDFGTAFWSALLITLASSVINIFQRD